MRRSMHPEFTLGQGPGSTLGPRLPGLPIQIRQLAKLARSQSIPGATTGGRDGRPRSADELRVAVRLYVLAGKEPLLTACPGHGALDACSILVALPED